MIRSASGTLDAPGKGWLPEPRGSLAMVWWALRALWTETIAFRFQYPIEAVPQAGPRTSLHYYVYSERLFFDNMELDRTGIPLQRSRILGKFHNPAYVAWYGLMALERSIRQSQPPPAAFQVQVDWLIRNALVRSDGVVVWPFPVDVTEGNCQLKAPWVSAMSQGLALSALVRGHRLGYGVTDGLKLCSASLQVFAKSVSDGGVRSQEGPWTLYEEYPGSPLPRVLDGFLFGLLGLYDFWIETEDPFAKELFDEGVSGLVHTIEYWNYKNEWSWYGARTYLCPSHYHHLNRLLILALGKLNGEDLLTRYAIAWDPARLPWAERVRLFVMFTWLKNMSRLGHRSYFND